jgi:hypothetical protein
VVSRRPVRPFGDSATGQVKLALDPAMGNVSSLAPTSFRTALPELKDDASAGCERSCSQPDTFPVLYSYRSRNSQPAVLRSPQAHTFRRNREPRLPHGRARHVPYQGRAGVITQWASHLLKRCCPASGIQVGQLVL